MAEQAQCTMGELMGRQETPLDPGRGPVERFAFELRKLRQEAGGVTYRTMARGCGYSVSTLSRAAAGEQLPSLPVVLAYVVACGGDTDEWERRWQAAVEEIARTAADEDGTDAPYQGLARFEPSDSARFFGRERLVAEVLDLMRDRRLGAVFGPSGSGKSSLLRAGLIPALREEPDPRLRPAAVRILTPGPQPARTHARAFTAAAAPGDTVVVVDQFEEIFTLCADPVERTAFIDLVLTARDPGSGIRVVLAVRADFYGRCADHDGLARALGTAGLLVGPMSPEELRAAIVRPATASGLIVEQALTARIVEEVAGESGGLPLMSHALLETWRRRKGRTLTTAAYDASGGLHGAVTRTAEDVLGGLTGDQADTARRILLRLITPGDGAPDTRRPVARAELAADGHGAGAAVLERLVRARLLTLDEGTVDLAHEALISGWPRLRAWVDADREQLRTHRRLTEAAAAWEALDRDPGALYRGTRLAAAEEAFADPGRRRALNAAEAEFLTASLDARARERRAAARTTRRLRALVAALTALLLVALAAAGMAVKQRAAANSERTTAVARQITAEADRLRGTEVPAQTQDVTLAALLDITSYRMRGSARAYTSLVQAANSALFRDVPEQGRVSTGVVYGPGGGRRLAYDRRQRVMAVVGEDGNVRLWDTTRFTHPRRVGRTLPGSVVGMTPDGRVLAAGGPGIGVRLWDVSDPAHPAPLGSVPAPDDGFDVTSLAFGNDGHLLAVSTGSIALWDVADPRKPDRLARSLPGDLSAFSPDRKVLATADTQGDTVRLWDTSHRGSPPALGVLHTRTDNETILSFSPDGRYLATNGAGTGQVPLWDVHRPDRPTASGFVLGTSDATEAQAVAYSPDGRIVAVSGDNGVQLWNIDAFELPTRLGQALGQRSSAGITPVFAPDGRSLITEDGVLRIWSLPPGVLLGCGTGTTGFSPNARTMATACAEGGPVRLWDITDPGGPRPLPVTLPGTAGQFAPHGHLLAVTTPDGGIRIYDATDPARPRALGKLAAARDHSTVLVAFAPEGRGLVTYEETSNRAQAIGAGIGNGDGRMPGFGTLDDGIRIRTWDLGDPRHPRETGRSVVLERNAGAGAVARAPDGRGLAVVDEDRRILLWDTSDAGHPRHRGRSFVGDVPAFAPHGHTLAIGSVDGTVRLWNTADPAHPIALGAALDAGGSVTGLAFDPSGTRLAVGTGDGLIKLYDVTDPAHATAVGDPLVGHTAETDSLVFAPGGRALTSSGLDGTTRLWTLDPERNIRRICAVTAVTLTRAQWRRHVGDLPYRSPCP
ncbi:helix-turn-helix domain-containing protein [Streptomyces sp. NPDC051987]|uniref:nSTAND1 domain-containing NTPase n=1 Tax=Streptomyces sp. NPDC051987 TaxID=3155808 RepID=UPI003443CC8F